MIQAVSTVVSIAILWILACELGFRLGETK